MERDLKFIFLLMVALAATGCAENNVPPGAGGSGGAGMGGSGGSGGARGEGEPGTPALAPLDAEPRFAVVSTDFSTTSIAVLDETFQIIDESWINSGTTYPGLVAALSGDVVLPTRQAGRESFAIIDRFLTDVVTQFYVPSGNLNGQVRTHGDVGTTGYSSNPQDLVFVDEHSAWAVRYEPNLDESAPPENQGTDLIEIDPSDMSLTGARFDLSMFNTVATVMGDSGPVEVDVFARPSRAVLIESKIVIGLERISASFDAAGSGLVALVDLENNSALGVAMGELENCGRVVPVPNESTKVMVACLGFSFPYGDEAQVRASSGIVVLDVGDMGVAVERIWRVADDPDQAIAVNAIVALDERRALGVANGDFATTTDALYLTNLTTGKQEVVHESTGSFTVGQSAYDSQEQALYVPDAASNEVVHYSLTEAGFEKTGSTAIAPGHGLQPTQVHLLDWLRAR